ncbi:MAG: hypothetical protein R3245_04770 [Kiloniellales bacterium]|nr:hypothetical protein [Kiloniellales bacterium]
MDLDELEAELGLLLTEMEGDLGDPHEIYLRLRQLLDQMRAYGMELPEDLLRMEQEMAAEFKRGDVISDGDDAEETG